MCKPFNSSTFYASVILLVVINLCTQLLNTTDSKNFCKNLMLKSKFLNWQI